MGGVPPLGYDVRERRLVINPSEANTVRLIYERYLKLGCVRQLSEDLEKRRIVSKVRVSKAGHQVPEGAKFSRGALYELLAKPHLHRRDPPTSRSVIPGNTKRFLPREVWERVQQRLNENAGARPVKTSNRSISSPLAGKLFDADGPAALRAGSD